MNYITDKKYYRIIFLLCLKILIKSYESSIARIRAINLTMHLVRRTNCKFRDERNSITAIINH